MKTILLKYGFLMVMAVAFTSCNEKKERQSVEMDSPQEVKAKEKEVADIADQAFIDGMTGKVWHNYLEIKMALANEDAGKVKDVSREMAESFSAERESVKTLSQQMADTDDIEKQRELFAQFSEEMGPMFENGLSGGTIYKKFCPMAFNKKGAYWYADVKEIDNPYFGNKMPNCGEINKTISK